MKKASGGMSKILLLALVIATIAIPIMSSAQATWKKFRYDEAQSGRTSEIGCRTADLYWRFSTGNFNFCSPAITASQEIIFGSRNGLFFALSPDGDVTWQYNAVSRVDSSPAIDSYGNIYFGTGSGLLHCIAEPTGIATEATFVWNYDAQDTIYSSPTLDQSEDSVFFGTADGRLVSIFSENYFATQGSLQWSEQLGDRIFASPAYRYYVLPPTASTLTDKAKIYIGAELGLYDGLMYAVEVPIDPSAGTLATIAWVYPDVGDEPIGPVDSSVAVSDDGNFIYFGSKDGNLYCLNSSGYLHWSYETSGMIDASPAISSTGDIIVGSRDGAVYSIGVDGLLNWSFETNGPIESSAAIDVYDNVFVGSRDHFLYSISSIGAQNWRYEADYHIWSSPVIGKTPSSGMPSPVVTSATIYFTCADHRIYALREDRSAPYFLSREPDDGETDVDRTIANITFELVDAQSDVDRESIVVLFRGFIVHPTFEKIDENDYKGWRCNYYCGDETFENDEVVEVNVLATDTAWVPNELDETYSFTIESSSRRLPSSKKPNTTKSLSSTTLPETR
ncbi:PQQ-like beta-propeller repeat protein [bacterium]|nr:PQQ-like beta-propeller repeat protein [bacterium]